MKKIVLVILILAVAAVLAFFIYEKGFKNNSQDFQEPQNTAETFDDPELTTSMNEAADSNTGSEGGNPDIFKYIDVTVSEDKYFYDNKEISLDDLIKVLDGLDKNTAVKITDENATLKAFEGLTKALAERGILFEAAN